MCPRLDTSTFFLLPAQVSDRPSTNIKHWPARLLSSCSLLLCLDTLSLHYSPHNLVLSCILTLSHHHWQHHHRCLATTDVHRHKRRLPQTPIVNAHHAKLQSTKIEDNSPSSDSPKTHPRLTQDSPKTHPQQQYPSNKQQSASITTMATTKPSLRADSVVSPTSTTEGADNKPKFTEKEIGRELHILSSSPHHSLNRHHALTLLPRSPAPAHLFTPTAHPLPHFHTSSLTPIMFR
jgi:hypothetical protein